MQPLFIFIHQSNTKDSNEDLKKTCYFWSIETKKVFGVPEAIQSIKIYSLFLTTRKSFMGKCARTQKEFFLVLKLWVHTYKYNKRHNNNIK